MLSASIGLLQRPCPAARAAACRLEPRHGLSYRRQARWTGSQRLQAGPDDLANLLADLDIPDIEGDLATFQEEQGATFTADGAVASYGNDAEALEAVQTGVAIADRSACGRIRISGDDRLTFLHGQSTADISALKPGQGCDTVFVTAQARCLDLASCLVQGSGVMLLVSPGMKQQLMERLDKYIFPGDKVQLTDVSDRTAQFSLLGPQAAELLSKLGVDAQALAAKGHGAHTLMGLSGKPLVVAVGGGLVPGEGFTLVADEAVGGDLWRTLSAQGAVPLGSEAWEVARVAAGRPAPGSELTADVNPLEAGLYHAVSVNKGCYIGQETIAKVHNLDAVKQQLWGIELEGPVRAGDAVSAGDKQLGQVSSYVTTPSGDHKAMAFLRCKSKGAQIQLADLAVTVAPAGAAPGSSGGVRGRVVALPALSRAFPGEDASGQQSGAESEAELAARSEAARQQKEAEAAAAAAAREEKLRAMQERLAAWQAQQQQQSGGA